MNIYEDIYKKHIAQLKHLNIKHEKLVICFSGIPGSGKTFAAKQIETHYKAVRVSNDELREIIAEIMIKNLMERGEEQNQKILHDYLEYFFARYDKPNKLIILDSGIDREYESKFSYFKKNGYPCLIIRIDIPLKEIKKRLLLREKKKPENNLRRLKKWIIDYRESKKKLKADMTIGNDAQDMLLVFKNLDKIIR